MLLDISKSNTNQNTDKGSTVILKINGAKLKRKYYILLPTDTITEDCWQQLSDRLNFHKVFYRSLAINDKPIEHPERIYIKQIKEKICQ